MLEAHYTTGNRRTVCFAVTTNGRREWLEQWVPVTGLRDARKLAAERGATPWNF